LIGAVPNEQYLPDGSQQEVMDVTFRIFGRPGQFMVHPVFADDWTAVAISLIAVKRDVVNAIYEGLASEADIPDLSTGAIGPLGPGH
jgi:hypothetical protein